MKFNNKYLDVRCILLCKAFQVENDVYDQVAVSLKNSFGETLQHYVSLGEYDGIFSFKLKGEINLLQEISNSNNILSKVLSDSIFYRPLYLVFPKSTSYDSMAEDFWDGEGAFFFASIVHTNHCCASFEYKEQVREHIINTIDEFKKVCRKNSNEKKEVSYKYRVYYSLDLSDYIIVWKTDEPAHILGAMKYLYCNTRLLGYTNTFCGVSKKHIEKNDDNIIGGNALFTISIQAVTKSYLEAKKVHDGIVKSMDSVISEPYFTFGNDDYLGVFNRVTPKELYLLHKNVSQNKDFKKAILSLNTSVAISGFDVAEIEPKKENDTIKKAVVMKKQLEEACKSLKESFVLFFNENIEIINTMYWKKPVCELLTQLDNMSKSTVFDSVCFLFLDSAHLFLKYLNHLNDTSATKEELKNKLIRKEQEIGTFIHEWEQLAHHVVSIDGTFQRTPGYESINYNMSASIVEYNNAFTQKIIQYFTLLDKENSIQKREMRIASFVVPRMSRDIKTTQWFYDARGKDSLLFITIPTAQLYEPFLVLTSLTHEVSHYCSSGARLRAKRAEHIIMSICVFICYKLEIFSNKTIYRCYELLMEMFDVKRENNSEFNFYLKSFTERLKAKVFFLFDNVYCLQELHNTYCEESLENNNENEIDRVSIAANIKRLSAFLIGRPNNFDLFGKSDEKPIYFYIDEIISLFKEGYADLMMVYVLSLKPSEYLKAAFLGMSKLDINNDIGKLHFRFQRMIVVCEALFDSGVWKRESFKEDICNSEKELSNIYQKFFEAYRDWKTNGDDAEMWRWFYPEDVLLIAIEYLKKCYSEISTEEAQNKSFKNRKEIENLFRDMIADGESAIFSESFQSLLQNNRENILNRWDNKEKDPFLFR